MSSTQQNHIPCEEWLESYLFGMLDEVEEQEFEGHAKHCKECSLALQAHQSFSNLIASPISTIATVEAKEHNTLLAQVFERHPEPLPPPQEDSNNPNSDESSWWQNPLQRILDSLGMWEWGGLTAAACLLLWIWNLSPTIQLETFFANGDTNLRFQQVQRHAKILTKQRTKVMKRKLSRPILAKRSKPIQDMTVHIELRGFAPLQVKTKPPTQPLSFDFVATAVKGVTKPLMNTHIAPKKDDSFHITIEPSPSLFLADNSSKESQGPTTKPLDSKHASGDVLEQTDTVLSIGQGGALVPSGKLATLASLEHKAQLLSYSMHPQHHTRMQVWNQRPIRVVLR